MFKSNLSQDETKKNLSPNKNLNASSKYAITCHLFTIKVNTFSKHVNATLVTEPRVAWVRIETCRVSVLPLSLESEMEPQQVEKAEQLAVFPWAFTAKNLMSCRTELCL